MNLKPNQIKEIANFLTTSAVAWFAAGVIAPLFAGSSNGEFFVLSEIFGLSTTLIFLALSVIIIGIGDKQNGNKY